MWQIVSAISLAIAAAPLLKSLGKDPVTNLRVLTSKWRSLAVYLEAQSKHETANWTSSLFRHQNNLFGMKCVQLRPHTGSCNTESGFQQYDSKASSIRDMLKWLDYSNFPTQVDSLEQYSAELKKRGYYEDTPERYTLGMRRFL